MFIRQPRPDCWKQASRATEAHPLRGRLVLHQAADLALQHLASAVDEQAQDQSGVARVRKSFGH